MKYNIKLIIIIIFCFSCSHKKEKNYQSPRIKLYTKIISPISNSILRDNDSITFEVKTNSKEIIKSSIILNLDTIEFNEKLRVSANKFIKYGKQKIQIKNEFLDKSTEILHKTFYLYPSQKPQDIEYKILKILPHDKNSYTQGLFIYDNHIFESSGQYGKSFIRKKNIYDNIVKNELKIDDNYFAEGITFYDDKLFMLTWKSNIGFIYDINSFEKVGEFKYQTEGWGITTYNEKLLMSDGTEKIYIRDPNSFKILDIIEVYDYNGKVKNINELEIINDKLFCNIYGEDLIVVIDIKSGKVESKIDFKNLLNNKNYNDKIDVMNGIAYNSKKKSIIVTGKWWPSMYEIQIFLN